MSRPAVFRPSHPITKLALSLAGVWMTGCASQGPLRPPSLHLPAPASAASAQRIGPAVELHWTNPTQTTDHADLKGRHEHALPLTAELCRIPPAAAACVPLARIGVTPGQASVYRDQLPADLSAGAPRALRYRLRITNATGRAAEPRELLTAAGEAPPAITGLTVAVGAVGTELGWVRRPSVAGDAMLIQVRTPAATSSAEASTSSPKTRANQLRVPLDRDPGGAIDSEGKPGDTYTAARSRPLPGTPVTLESTPSTFILSADALPPAPPAPTGLATTASSLGGAPRIDLSWDSTSLPGIRYLVQRGQGDSPQVNLTAAPFAAFSYTDSAVVPGTTYTYTVVAVDSHGTRSVPSRTASETAPTQ